MTLFFFRCPNSEYITGKFCEQIRCSNGGRDNGKGGCSCAVQWYSGQFCQVFFYFFN